MAIEVKLPELGDGIESGDVLDVFVSEGETIAKEQSICEIETDKATVEVPSSHAGKIVKVHVTTGQSVAIGATLLTLETAEVTAPAPTQDAAPPAAEPKPEPKPERTAPPAAETARPPVAAPPPAATPAPPAPAPRPASPQPAPAASPALASGPAPAGPAIRRLAREVGIDLAQIVGTGSGGRITRDDVLTAVRRSSAQPVSAPASAAEDLPAKSSPAPLTTESAEDDWGPIRVERMTKIRKTIASKMYDSWSTAPRVTNFDDADITELERIRQVSKSDYASRGLKLTTMPFVIKAIAMALRSNPTLNASIDEINEQIVYKQYVNLGIAVDTERGLIVPALRRADELGIPDLTRALNGIAENARNNNFKLEDLRGSTFTISNLGAVGGTYSTPIINVPEVAILLLGRSRKLPVVVDDEIKVRLMMPLSLSYDHRLVDGAAAARFLNDVIDYLEHPSRLLIAP